MANPFVDYTGGLTNSFGFMVSSFVDILIKIIVGILLLTGITGFFIIMKRRKMYNIPVTIWIPRSNGQIIDEIEASGGYFKVNKKGGGSITSFRLKRKGLPVLDIPPPPSRFLVGSRKKLYLIQKGVDDFEPVLPDGFKYVNTERGERLPIINLKCINQDATAWVEDNRENAMRRFTFSGFWEKYKDFIQITIFTFIVMISIYIMWIGLSKVTTGLDKVANTLAQIAQTTKGSVTVK